MTELGIKAPLISIIVPCYKVEQYLPRCVDSILNQTYKNLEIWLVDDGSPDKCGQICEDYAKRDSRIKVIHKENGGLSDARNVAIDKATGEWITFVDSDDYIADDYVETLHKLVEKYSCEVSVCLFLTFFEGEVPMLPNKRVVEEKIMPMTAVEQMLYQEKFETSAWGKLYHRRLFDSKIRYPKGVIFEDLATTYKLIFLSNGVAFTNKQIYYYLIRSNSIEGEFRYDARKVESLHSVLNSMDADKELDKVKDAYQCRKFSFILHLLLPMPKDAKYYKEMKSFIIQKRWTVLKNRRARKKARIAALLSYLGIDALRFIYKHASRRK